MVNRKDAKITNFIRSKSGPAATKLKYRARACTAKKSQASSRQYHYPGTDNMTAPRRIRQIAIRSSRGSRRPMPYLAEKPFSSMDRDSPQRASPPNQ